MYSEINARIKDLINGNSKNPHALLECTQRIIKLW